MEAEILDANEKPVEAAAAYEAAIVSGDATLETYLNVAVLYWVATDSGYFSYHHLPDEFVIRAGRRAKDLLSKAELKFGCHNEIDFWRYYFDYVSLGHAARIDYCVDLATRGPSLVPYFHLFELTGDRKYRSEAQALLASIEPPRTERARYVQSVLRSAFGQY